MTATELEVAVKPDAGAAELVATLDDELGLVVATEFEVAAVLDAGAAVLVATLDAELGFVAATELETPAALDAELGLVTDAELDAIGPLAIDDWFEAVDWDGVVTGVTGTAVMVNAPLTRVTV